jgi:hypothetical protein
LTSSINCSDCSSKEYFLGDSVDEEQEFLLFILIFIDQSDEKFLTLILYLLLIVQDD